MRSVTIAVLCWLAILPYLSHADEYSLTHGRFSERADLHAAVWQEFLQDLQEFRQDLQDDEKDPPPPRAVAEWRDIADTCDPSVNETAAADCPVNTIGRGAALLLRDGAPFCPWGGRYFVTRDDDNLPSRYQLIDTEGGLALYCGPITAPILVRLLAQGEPAGIVSPALDLYLPNLRWFAPRGPRNIWAHLEFYGFDAQGDMLWRLQDFDNVPQQGE